MNNGEREMTFKLVGDMRERKIVDEENSKSYYFEEIVDVLNKQECEIEELKREIRIWKALYRD